MVGKSGVDVWENGNRCLGNGTWLGLLKPNRQRNGPRLVAGGVGAHVTPGVDGGVVHADFVMDVRACGAPADAGVADYFAALDARAGNGGKGGEMRVPGGDAQSVVNHHKAAVAGGGLGM